MDFKITPILDSNKIIDKAFRRAAKKEKTGKNRLESVKKTTMVKLKTCSKVIESTLKRYEREFPSFEHLPEFYREIIDITLDIDKLKHSLGAMNWARRNTKRNFMESVRKVAKMSDPQEITKERKHAYGRASSFMNQISEELEFLEDARKKLNSLPDIRTDIPTAVVAGYPNVGKSLLVSKISSGKPKIARYPFTTQEVGIGHFFVDGIKCQLIDTPGLLDRPTEERNEIEMQAVKALESLADLIIFLYDPTGTCGYPMEKQVNLHREIQETFSNVKIIVVHNKLDLIEEQKEGLYISALEENNLDALEDLLGKEIKLIYKSKNSITDVR